MFWTIIIFTGLATVFVKLGAYSVWMAVFSAGLKLLFVVIAAMLFWMLFRNKAQKQR
jgi:hypothetical protein